MLVSQSQSVINPIFNLPPRLQAFLGRWMLNRAAEELVPDLKTMPVRYLLQRTRRSCLILYLSFSFEQVEEAVTVTSLLLNGQEHLFKDWPAPGQGSEHKTHLLRQLVTLNEQYDGGLGGMFCSFINSFSKTFVKLSHHSLLLDLLRYLSVHLPFPPPP